MMRFLQENGLFAAGVLFVVALAGISSYAQKGHMPQLQQFMSSTVEVTTTDQSKAPATTTQVTRDAVPATRASGAPAPRPSIIRPREGEYDDE